MREHTVNRIVNVIDVLTTYREKMRGRQMDEFMLAVILNETPDFDAAPVVHAHWIDEGPFCSLVKCSQCGNFLDMRGVNSANFCPYCGAKMDEEEGK